jgi:hypothetical protein
MPQEESKSESRKETMSVLSSLGQDSASGSPSLQLSGLLNLDCYLYPPLFFTPTADWLFKMVSSNWESF